MNSANAAANLASVVFLKIQEFARRPAQEQARLRAQLEAVVAQVGNQVAGHAAEDIAPIAAEFDEGAAEIEDHAVDGHARNYINFPRVAPCLLHRGQMGVYCVQARESLPTRSFP